jgi:hypothetical protein
MTRIKTRLFLIIFTGTLAASNFDIYFMPKTMRLDYTHTGNHSTEMYAFDEVYQEPVWAGPKDRLIDESNLGQYRFQIFDKNSGTLLYSRGFCSVFGEWKATAQAKQINRSFSESIRFPWPRATVHVVISERDTLNAFQRVWTIDLDPAEMNFRRSETFSTLEIVPLEIHGDPGEKVDIVILPDGYTRSEMKKFKSDARRLTDRLFSLEPFKSARKQFNVRAVNLPSGESGIDNPRVGIYRDNALGCSYNAFGSDRYVLSWDNKTIRKAASRVPYESICILVNSAKYGGGGIFNLYSITASDNYWSDYVFVHEFGHSFGGLGDEYYTSDVAFNEFYRPGVEPWEPNLTATLDPQQLKWADLMDSGTPVPTPWEKEVFDANQKAYLTKRMGVKTGTAAADSLTAANDQWVHDFLRNQTWWDHVGVYEGGGYASQGIYRPFIDCCMFTRSLTGFDPVCSRAIRVVIRQYSIP